MDILRRFRRKAKPEKPAQERADAGDVHAKADQIRKTLANFNIDVKIERANIGPTVTQYIFKPPSGVSLRKLNALENNLALDLGVSALRIDTTLPGGDLVAIELPNEKRARLFLENLLSGAKTKDLKEPLEFIAGMDVSAELFFADLAKMPHLLIGGETGSGKTVMLNTILINLLLKNTPETLRLILIDPRVVEYRLYADIPHLERPILTEPAQWMDALHWLEKEVSRRKQLFAENNVNTIDEYNAKAAETLPRIVVISDEFSDMMMFNDDGKEIERIVAAITPDAQATGAHLIISTSRPSTKIYTEVIKQNFSARLAFATNSAVDSQTIIDESGAEKLLGAGDGLFKDSSDAKPMRLQAAYMPINDTRELIKDLGNDSPKP